jgi:hypothetical protein
MPVLLHHVDSASYGYLTPECIDFTLECVRDATEVLFANDALSARDMIVIARAVVETEQQFAKDPRSLTEPNFSTRSDWTLACMADALAQAVSTLRAHGRGDPAAQARADLRAVLQRLAKSPLRSPAVSYVSVLSALVHDFPATPAREQLGLLRLAIAENLTSQTHSNVMGLLCELGDCYVQLGMLDMALHLYLSLVRFDPLDVPVHQHLVSSVRRDAPEVALAAAERALLLLPREDKHGLRPQLRGSIEALRGQTSTGSTAFARALLAELTKPPGKKSRIALRTLCVEVDPAIADVPEREPEPLPDAVQLAQLRSALRAFPLPYPAHVQRELDAQANALQRTAPSSVPPAKISIGRNDRCPCGSEKKWKRCCGARKP